MDKKNSSDLKKIEIVLLGLVNSKSDFKIIQQFEELGFPQPIVALESLLTMNSLKKKLKVQIFFFFLQFN